LEIGVFEGVGQFQPNFHVLWDVPVNHFCTDR